MHEADPAAGPAYAVLRLVAGDRIPTGELGEETVPQAVLASAMKLAIDSFVEHGKNCPKAQCHAIPRSLWLYSRWTPDGIRKSARDPIYKVLWVDAEHEFVTKVREQILAERPELAGEIASGGLLNGQRLADLLGEFAPDGPRIIATALWASNFDSPHARTLFRMLVPLVDSGIARPTPAAAATNQADLKATQEELHRTVRAAKQTTRDLEKATREVDVMHRSVAKARQDLDELRVEHGTRIEGLTAARNEIKENEAALDFLTRNLEKTTRVSNERLKDLRQLQADRRSIDVQRGQLAQNLAAAKREIENLTAELGIIPQGAEEVWRFLRDEDKRIDDLRITTFGGPKAAADLEWAAHKKLKTAFLEAYPGYRQPPLRKIRPKARLRFVALGGAGEIGRSCYLIQLGTRNILIDCGIKPGASTDAYPAIDQIDHVDALVLTHAHADHLGWVPALVQRFGKFTIYCSEGTAALLPVMLDDCRRQYVRKLSTSRERAAYSPNASAPTEQYDEKDLNVVPRLVITCPWRAEEPLPFDGVSVTFYPAGHIIGAASVLIKDETGRRIFVSGDFSSFSQLTVPAASWPEDLGEVDLLVLESTYGNRRHPPLEESRADLVSFIARTIGGSGGSVILASFALGRAQELLSIISAAKKSGAIAAAVPVHVDGLVRSVNPIYSSLHALNFELGDINEVSGAGERQEIVFDAGVKPAIIVTTSGMMNGGPVVGYAQQLLPDPRHRIVFCGYQDEGAPSGALLDLTREGNGARVVELDDERGERISFRAAMPAHHVQLSAHADQPGLIEYAGRLRPRVIALVHGKPDAQAELRSLLLAVHDRAEIACGHGELIVP